ncbi:MAG: fructose-bisphosphatase class II, partial [candidate division Zixibacteria bacterium]|nr:fructose-bisphosphatase class II [candidate division Zixibacteria bacterium]
MDNNLRFNIADQRLKYKGMEKTFSYNNDRIIEFNHRHRTVLANYDITLKEATIFSLDDRINSQSNLGALRNRQLRESGVISAALSAIGVGLFGRGALTALPAKQRTTAIANEMKRSNDRMAAQIMAEVLHITSNKLPVGEEVLIASTITEGVRVKPGKEAGGNPTIAVGALFGKREHRAKYGLPMTNNVTLLSMGSDVIDGTTKSVKGLHSSFTAMFLTESGVKRHLPDIYVQRWMGGAYFNEFNPREASLVDAADIISKAYGYSGPEKLNAFYLDRPRHHPAMDELNKAGVGTPYDDDGDLFPALILGFDDAEFPNGTQLNSMIGEIGGSAEWAVGVLPLVWRGGQAIGMLTSQTILTRNDLDYGEKWRQRFHFTEEEFMLMQDARFEQKPYFTIQDIMEDPFAGGISAFGAITDSYYLPYLDAVSHNEANNTITVNTLVINSLGIMEVWRFVFECNKGLQNSRNMMRSPKDALIELSGKDLEKAIGKYMDDDRMRMRYRICFNNEYYPALIPVRDRLVLLHNAVETLIERGALN